MQRPFFEDCLFTWMMGKEIIIMISDRDLAFGSSWREWT